MREDRERAPGAAVGDLALEGELVEVEAALGREVREVAADLGHAVGVLHRADVLARLVAADPHRPADEARGLGREARGRLPLRRVVDAVPTAAALDHDDDGDERGDQREPREQACERPARDDDARLLALARLGDERVELLLALAAVRDPDLALLVADEHELGVVAAVAELLAVDVLRQPSAAPGRRLLPQPADEELELEREGDDERQPDGDDVAEPQHVEQPRDDEHGEPDAEGDGHAEGHFQTRCESEWGREDSNLRRLSRRVYSPFPLAARAHPRGGADCSRQRGGRPGAARATAAPDAAPNRRARAWPGVRPGRRTISPLGLVWHARGITLHPHGRLKIAPPTAATTRRTSATRIHTIRPRYPPGSRRPPDAGVEDAAAARLDGCAAAAWRILLSGSVPLRDEPAVAPDDSDRRTFDVFLSHNSADKPIVERIAERLKRARLEPWLDAWCLVAGRPTGRRGWRRAWRASRACAVFVGPERPRRLGAPGGWRSRSTVRRRIASFRLFLVLLPGLPEPFDPAGLSPFLRHAHLGRLPPRARRRAGLPGARQRDQGRAAGAVGADRGRRAASARTAASRRSTRSTPSSSSAATPTSSGCSRS